MLLPPRNYDTKMRFRLELRKEFGRKRATLRKKDRDRDNKEAWGREWLFVLGDFDSSETEQIVPVQTSARFTTGLNGFCTTNTVYRLEALCCYKI